MLIPAFFTDPFDFAERWFGMTYTVPPYLFWVLLIISLVVASFLTYRELYVEAAKKDTPAVTLQRKTRLSWAHRETLRDIETQMEEIHGHSDPYGLEADMLDGVLGGDLMKRPCHRCGKPRNQKGDYVSGI